MLTILTLLLAEAPTGLETSTAAAAHVTALRPALPANFPGTWATSNDYPPQALHNMEQGATGYELSIAPDGHADSCIITASSGSLTLDEATCRLVVDRARLSPATDAGGRAVHDRRQLLEHERELCGVRHLLRRRYRVRRSE